VVGVSFLRGGLLRADARRSLRGLPGITQIPILNRLFGGEDSTVTQTDIVMLLTPRIVRTHELTVEDVSPIFVGTSQNMELSMRPPAIGVPPPDDAAGAPGAAPAAAPGSGVPALPAPGVQSAPVLGVPDAGNDGQVLVSPPAATFTVGGGPYTVPITLSGARRVGALSLTLTYNPAVLRVQGIQEGTFMRAGGVDSAFTQQLDATTGRIDITTLRPGDTTDAAGTGMVAAVLFEAIAPGPIDLRIIGMGSATDGMGLSLQFVPVPPVTVQ
jgi:general secretion pathway protein D